MQFLACLCVSLRILASSASATNQLRTEAIQLTKDVLPTDAKLAEALDHCSARPSSHVCDPGQLLTPTSLAEVRLKLQHLSTPERVLVAEASPGQKAAQPNCPQLGYEVYIALLNVPAESVRASAAALGRSWGVIGGECSNGVIAVYSTPDKVLAVAADRQLEERVLPPQLEGLVERSSLGLQQSSPEEVVSTLVTKLELVLHGEIRIVHPTLMQFSAEFLLYSVTSCVALAASALIVCCFYDVASRWRHRARFHGCVRKVKRVHEVLLSRHGELPICPHCVEFVSSEPSAQVVVFLCGHRFHLDCVDRKTGACPICEPRKPAEDIGDDTRNSLCTQDEAKPFFLRSLSRQYPEIIDKDCVQRWRDCHTEIWLSELNCPRYASIFQHHK